MKTRIDEGLRNEAGRFAFRFACDDCVHFDESGAHCSLQYPASPRRNALENTHIELCKSFELA